jgi:valyl-tRNA synthetase
MISGHVLAGKGSKISKSKDNAPSSPQELIDKYSADPVRYWTAGARLGRDAEYSTEVIEDGRKLINKIWNAIKFSIMNLDDFDKKQEGPKNIIDKWILHRLTETIKKATNYLEDYEFGLALSTIEDFFWGEFCDNYIELSKQVFFRGEEDEQLGTQKVLYRVAYDILKMFSPYLPHLTEDLYQRFFSDFEDEISIHIADWPEANEDCINKEINYEMEKILEFVELIRKSKSENNLSLRHPIDKISYECDYEKVDISKAMKQISFLLWIDKVEDDFEPDYTAESENGKLRIKIKWGEK